MTGAAIGRQLAGIRERFDRPICPLTQERFMIDNNATFAGLEQQVDVAGRSLAVLVDA
jgi:hypothetical protein